MGLLTAYSPALVAGGDSATAVPAKGCDEPVDEAVAVPVDSVEGLRGRYASEPGFVDVLLMSWPTVRVVVLFDLDARGGAVVPVAVPLADGLPVEVVGERFEPLLAPPETLVNDPPLLGDPCFNRISPGQRISTPVGGCSLNFIFVDAAGKYYAGTAGHCFSALGQTATVPTVGVIGSVIYRLSAGIGNDFALIEIDPAKYGSINAAMCNWGGPTGITDVSSGLVRHYGFPIGYGSATQTRARTGLGAGSGATSFTMEGLVASGDSGSGARANAGPGLGVITHVNAGVPGVAHSAPFAYGTLLSRSISLAEGGTGLDLSVVTAAVT